MREDLSEKVSEVEAFVLDAEVDELRRALRVQPVRVTRISPKAMGISQLVGLYDPEVVSWTEGVLSKSVRELSAEESKAM